MATTFKVTMLTEHYIRGECSDGKTYAYTRDAFPRRAPQVSMCCWLTGSRDPDEPIEWRRLPVSVRAGFNTLGFLSPTETKVAHKQAPYRPARKAKLRGYSAGVLRTVGIHASVLGGGFALFWVAVCALGWV